MRTLVQTLFLILFSSAANAKQIKIAVVDTGLSQQGYKMNINVCPTGHYDYTIPDKMNDNWSATNTPTDNHGHGTHVAGLIHQGFVGKVVSENPETAFKEISKVPDSSDYCLVILKYFDPTAPKTDNLKATVKAFKRAAELNVDFINYSGGGVEYSEDEHEALRKVMQKGIEVVAAVGNEYSNLKKHPYYPAMYFGVIAVGSYTYE